MHQIYAEFKNGIDDNITPELSTLWKALEVSRTDLKKASYGDCYLVEVCENLNDSRLNGTIILLRKSVNFETSRIDRQCVTGERLYNLQPEVGGTKLNVPRNRQSTSFGMAHVDKAVETNYEKDMLSNAIKFALFGSIIETRFTKTPHICKVHVKLPEVQSGERR